MTTHLVTVRDTVTAAEALEEIRRQAEEVEDFYQVFVVDARSSDWWASCRSRAWS